MSLPPHEATWFCEICCKPLEPNADPGWKKFGSGMEKIRIRDKHPGSATLESTGVSDKNPHCYGSRGSGSLLGTRIRIQEQGNKYTPDFQPFKWLLCLRRLHNGICSCSSRQWLSRKQQNIVFSRRFFSSLFTVDNTFAFAFTSVSKYCKSLKGIVQRDGSRQKSGSFERPSLKWEAHPLRPLFQRLNWVSPFSLPVYSHLSQQGLARQGHLQASPRSCTGFHCTVANIKEEFIAPLQISRSVHSTIANRE